MHFLVKSNLQMRRGLQSLLLLLLLLLPVLLSSAEDYYALVIRGVDPIDQLLLAKTQINRKTELYRLTAPAPLTVSQYKRLAKLRFAEIHSFSVVGGRLRVRTRTNQEVDALPASIREWAGALAPQLTRAEAQAPRKAAVTVRYTVNGGPEQEWRLGQ